MPTTPRADNGQFAKTAFTVLVTGSRNWDKIEVVRDEIVKIKALAESLGFAPSQVTLVHGNARGADRTAGTFAAMVGFNVISVPADWKKHYFVDGAQVCRCDIPTAQYCKMAGINRNLQMLNDHKPDMVLAFNRDSSSGTMHTISESRKRGLITNVVRYNTDEVSATLASDVVEQDGTSHTATVKPPVHDTVVHTVVHTGAQVTDDPFAKYNV